jgi:hypothetical protein
MLVNKLATRIALGVLLASLVAISLAAYPKHLLPGKQPSQTSSLNTAALSTQKIRGGWSLQVDEKTGLPILSKGGQTALSNTYSFWGTNWAWAGMQTKFNLISPYHYQLTGNNRLLDFNLTEDISKASEHKLVWEIDLDARSTQADVIGGGMVFKFDLATFNQEMGEPALLPNNAGWTWGKPGGSHIEMRFSPSLPSIYFERDKKGLRAFFYDNTVPQGKTHYTVTLDVSSDIAIKPTSAERFGSTDTSKWYDNVLDWRTSPVDLSYLNADDKPAGKRGFVKAKGDQLVFGDGTQARFWGTNVTAYALFMTPHDMVQEQAKRLSALGFNLVRIHHFDSPWVNPNIFGDKDAQNTQTLNSDALDKLDWWIKCLKDEGIYVWLDLHDLRALKPGDNIYGFDEISKGKGAADLKGYDYVNLTIQEAMKRFDEAYVNHVNRYTGVAYKDEPAIIAMLITNEDDITYHFGNILLPDKNVPLHDKIYMHEAESFAKAHDLPVNMAWRSWEAGPSKLFLNDLEHRFNVDMIDHLRAQGVKCLIATTSYWGGEPLFSLPALTTGDLIDAHAYQDTGVFETNPMVSANLVDWLAAAQVAGKPVSVTEWNASDPFPVRDRQDLPLYVAAQASLQGWDALMQYAYSQAPIKFAGTAGNFQAYNDPSLIATLPAAALLYRRGDVQESNSTYVFSPSKEQLFYQDLTPSNSPALRTAVEKGKLLIALPKTKELPWLKPSVIPANAKVFSDPGKPLLSIDASEATSDTGELKRNWDEGVFTIDTPRTEAAMGWIGGKDIALRNVDIQLSTRNATVAVQSLDGKPIDKSSRLMISLGAQAIPNKGGHTPYLSEPVLGELTIRAPKGLRLFQSGRFPVAQEKPVTYRNGKYEIPLDRSLNTYWLFLKKTDS